MDNIKKEITIYLSGPRDHFEGAMLYQRYGANLRLKREFAVDDTASTHEMLIDELRKLAGITEAEFLNLPRRVRPSTADTFNGEISLSVEIEEVFDYEQPVNEDTPETVKKMLRFREKYDFLNSPDCPDVLKILVADMFTAYGEYKAAHARLQTLGDEDSAAAVADCEKVVSEYLRNREIWEELEYYREHGTILGKASKFKEIQAAEDLSALADVDLMKQLQSATVQVSKQKKKVAEGHEKAAASLEYWTAQKQALSEELARRKKK